LAYQYLIGAKPNNLMVVVPSQPRRSDGALSMRSVAESWAKAWYADIMIALMSAGRGSILAQTVKNRFGKNNEKMFFDYDPVDCSWGVGAQDWEDDDW
ncbi:MAG: hypothetical protein KDA94_16945, partial [Acidimicrobiales bacterium]|nr:hypothetical protein [Acidimicrobiales bacterium]